MRLLALALHTGIEQIMSTHHVAYEYEITLAFCVYSCGALVVQTKDQISYVKSLSSL